MDPINITDSAILKIKEFLIKESDPKSYWRIGVQGGGCSGYSYVMKAEARPLVRERDILLEMEYDTLVVTDHKSMEYLSGATLDYIRTGNLTDRGWLWTNPNAAKKCGCGLSFETHAKKE